MQTKGHVEITEAFANSQPGDAHRIMIYNARTGDLELKMENVAGGIVIAQSKDEGLLGTDQFAFGVSHAIVVCALKAKAVIRQMLKADPKLGASIERANALARQAGLDTTLEL